MRLNKLIAFFLCCLAMLTAKAQNFEGEIVYQNSYKSKQSNVTDEQWQTVMGSRQNYFVKGGNYKSIFNGSFMKSHFYRAAENKSYLLTGQNDTLYWEDYSINKDIATKFMLIKAKEKIMGLMCDALIVEAPETKTTYYFNSKYSVNPELYKNHNYGNWYYMLSKTKAIPLKIVIESKLFTQTTIAVEVNEKKLDDSVFELPDKNKVAKANW